MYAERWSVLRESFVLAEGLYFFFLGGGGARQPPVGHGLLI